MAQLSTKIKEYCKANSVSDVDFTTNVLLQDDGQGAYIKEWNLAIAQPTDEQLNSYENAANIYEANQQVIQTRKSLYGSIEQQIEYITENGIEAWQNKVQQIKTDNPKS
tara:strand:+ start:39 stop:365 length:327 start_codon:yes stop_codon:yes gene_type:complete